MNVLIFSAIYPAPEEYGIPDDTKVVHYFAKQWQRMGHNIQVVYLHLNPVKKILKSNYIKKILGSEADYELDGISVHMLDYQLLVPRKNYLTAVQAKDAQKRIERFLENSFTPDKVFVHFPCSFKGISCLSDFDCPTMAVIHNIDLEILNEDKKLCHEIDRYKNIGGRNRRICHAVSEKFLRDCSLVMSGIDADLISSEECVEQKLSKSSDSVKIVYAGKLIKSKNVDVIIKALNKMDFRYEFYVVGDGVEMEGLTTLAEGNPRISFKGRLSREATVEMMRAADVFVMASRPETFGLVYIEAMAQGCVTIGSKNEGIDGVIVDGENGFLVEPGSVEALTECFEKIFKLNNEAKRNIVNSAYHTAKNMTDEEMAVKYFNLNN